MACGRLGDEFERTCFIFGGCWTTTVRGATGAIVVIASMTGVSGRDKEDVAVVATAANGERPGNGL